MKEKIIMAKNTNLSIEESFNLFMRKVKVRNLSERTIITYQKHFKIFSDFIDVSTNLIQDIDENTVDEFILFLRSHNKVNDITINSYLRTIRAFLYYSMDCKYLESFKIRMPKVEKKLKETYSEDELQRLLTKPNINQCSFTEYKTWVFENYLLGTGNRISSALSLTIQDINFEDNVIMLRKTKNRRQQIIPLSNTLSDILTEYLEIRGGKPDDYLFCNIYGEQGSLRTFEQMVQEYNIKHNVNKTSCHLFRHTFAKNWILAGGDIFRLQKILGHSTLDVTKEYVQMFGNDLQLDFEKFNPLDNFKTKQSVIRM